MAAYRRSDADRVATERIDILIARASVVGTVSVGNAGLRIENNVASLAPGFDKSPAFVADYAHDRPIMANNRLAAGYQVEIDERFR